MCVCLGTYSTCYDEYFESRTEPNMCWLIGHTQPHRSKLPSEINQSSCHLYLSVWSYLSISLWPTHIFFLSCSLFSVIISVMINDTDATDCYLVWWRFEENSNSWRTLVVDSQGLSDTLPVCQLKTVHTKGCQAGNTYSINVLSYTHPKMRKALCWNDIEQC